MNRREDLQQFFISANTSQDRYDFDFEKFTDEYLIRNPVVVKEKCDLDIVVGRSEQLPFAFIKWYSGIEERKIRKAYERWKREEG